MNPIWPSGAIWRHRSGPTLAQVMACCLTAPSHYMNQCWLVINKAQWHSSECDLSCDNSAINHWNQFKKIRILNWIQMCQGGNGSWLVTATYWITSHVASLTINSIFQKMQMVCTLLRVFFFRQTLGLLNRFPPFCNFPNFSALWIHNFIHTFMIDDVIATLP